MVSLRPANYFLCCLPLSLGTKLILWAHLAQSVYTCAMSIGNVMLDLNASGYATSAASQIFTGVWSMASIPIILAALWGVYHNFEVTIRLYMYYLILATFVDVVYLADLLVLKDACVHLKVDALANGGQAFACGVARTISGTTAAVATLGMFYLIYMVWSHCRELTEKSSSGAIAELLTNLEQQALQESTKLWDSGIGDEAGYRSALPLGGSPYAA
mmetsp:Transcript_70925/g.140744  ORF Transcript_70925/g.140744 Transcript_70925/m.140744 type:complete len:216 (-) Transcript_70925:171-818(-)